MGDARSFTAIIKQPAMPQYRLRWNSLLQLVCTHRFTHDAPETYQSLLQESEPFAMNFTSAFQGYQSQRQWPVSFPSCDWSGKKRSCTSCTTGLRLQSLVTFAVLLLVTRQTRYRERSTESQPAPLSVHVLLQQLHWQKRGGGDLPSCGILMAVFIKSGNSGLTSCRLVNGYRRYEVASWFHLQFLSGLTISSILFPQLDW